MVSVAFKQIYGKIESIAAANARKVPRLVAVSKTKPIEDIMEVYSLGHRSFGENYVHELLEKAPKLPTDIQWHFIGQLQSNKVKSLVTDVPNLYMIESVDSIKLAEKIEKACVTSGRSSNLRILIQVNTSDEEQKGGLSTINEIVELVQYVLTNCPHITFSGLMTIGKLGEVANIYFEKLSAMKAELLLKLPELQAMDLELSMGMSADFEQAILCGSTSVRVGSSIFGERVKKSG
jgi:PLP dependent protein